MSPAILGYGCSSSAGSSVSELWDCLRLGEDRSTPISTAHWPVPVQFQPWTFRSAHIDDLRRANSQARELLGSELLHVWHEAQAMLTKTQKMRLKRAKIGVIFASTKSFIEDFIWNSHTNELTSDAMTPLLNDFLNTTGLTPTRTACISNACASSLSAIYLANHWLKSGIVTDVWVIAADLIGPFVLQGFHCLHALTDEKVRPFAQNRSGLLLGDGATAILLSTSQENPLKLKGCGIETEGISVTRPSGSGESLINACLQIEQLQTIPPDLIIAHGTATALNDPAEDQAFTALFGVHDGSPLITASKGCIGHTLGASGSMDLIAACEVLKRQKVFCINNTNQIDTSFKGRYLHTGHSHVAPARLNGVLVTSLGFGGVNAAAMVELQG